MRERKIIKIIFIPNVKFEAVEEVTVFTYSVMKKLISSNYNK